jgi:membrane associated rhomboid family serine protease
MSSTSPQPGADMPPDFETHLPPDLEVRFCYRHPDRETGVSCASCGRPICHECMIPAAVGFQCPECVRGRQTAGTRARVVTRSQTRSRWQNGMVGARGGFTVTRALIALNVVFFLLELITGASALLGGGSYTALLRLGAMQPDLVALNHEYWRMLASMFLHLGLIHILFNMWALYVLGDFLEAVLGSVKFLVVYVLSGLAGSVLILVSGAPHVPTVGASGAIFGVFGALAVYAFFNRHRDAMARGILNQIVFLLVINLAITFGFSGISWQAHVGGLIGGAATMTALTLGGRRDPRGRFQTFDWLVVVSVALVLVALTWWRVSTFPVF